MEVLKSGTSSIVTILNFVSKINFPNWEIFYHQYFQRALGMSPYCLCTHTHYSCGMSASSLEENTGDSSGIPKKRCVNNALDAQRPVLCALPLPAEWKGNSQEFSSEQHKTLGTLTCPRMKISISFQEII